MSKLPGHAEKQSVLLAALLATLAGAPAVLAQELVLPRASPRARVTQTVGVSTITIDFGRPGVKGRQLWGKGGLVPYNGGDPLPWRTGADEPTTVELSHDVEIEGQSLAAGRYGLFTIPDHEEWIVIFSSNTENSFAYDQDQDVLRVTVVPTTAPVVERLLFEFEQLDEPEKVTMALRWGSKRVPLVARFDLERIVLDQAREILSSNPEGWQPWFQAASFSLDQGGDCEEALQWIEESISREETRANLSLKARLLEELGRDRDAETVRAGLDRFSREAWQRVDEILGWMRAKPGAMVADVGAGGGFMTTRLAAAVGDSGQVFAVDVDARSLERLSALLEEKGVENATVVHGAKDNPRLPPGRLDAILIVNAYHEMESYQEMLEAFQRSLVSGGRVVLVEPMSESSRGADREDQVRNHHLDIALAIGELEAGGFRVVEAQDPFVTMPGGGIEWLLVAEKR